ncbi:MAG: ATP-binding protein, partial [Oscillospiraceae bacterium]
GSSIVISAAKENGIIKISVSDDGDGVADSDKEKLFDMFYTANGSRTVDGRRGLGLGLALCKSIVNAHGGDISVRDNLPRGTVFEFTLIAEEVGICE